MLFNLLDEMLGTTTKVRVLRVLLRLDGPVSGSEAKRLAQVRSAASMWSALNELSELGILTRERTRGSHLYWINRDHHLFSALQALFDAEGQRLSALRERLLTILEGAGLGEAVLSAILFGSHARGDAKAGSPVELMLVTRGKGEVAGVREALRSGSASIERAMGLRLTGYVLARDDLAARFDADDALVQGIASEGGVLFGQRLREVIGEG